MRTYIIFKYLKRVIAGVFFAIIIIWGHWDQFVHRRFDENLTWLLYAFCRIEILVPLVILVMVEFLCSEMWVNIKYMLWANHVLIAYTSCFYILMFFIMYIDGGRVVPGGGDTPLFMHDFNYYPGDVSEHVNSGVIRVRNMSVTPWGDGLLTLRKYITVPANTIPVNAVVVAPVNEVVPVVNMVVPANNVVAPAVGVVVPGVADVAGFTHNLAVVPYRIPGESPKSIERFTSIVVVHPLSISFLLGDSEHLWLNPRVFGHGNYIALALLHKPAAVSSRISFESSPSQILSGQFKVVSLPPLSNSLRGYPWLDAHVVRTSKCIDPDKRKWVPSLPWYTVDISEGEMRTWIAEEWAYQQEAATPFKKKVELAYSKVYTANKKKNLPMLIKAFEGARATGHEMGIPWSFILRELHDIHARKQPAIKKCLEVIVWSDWQQDVLRPIKWPWTILPNDPYWSAVKDTAWEGWWKSPLPETKEEFDRLDQYPGRALDSPVFGPNAWGWPKRPK